MKLYLKLNCIIGDAPGEPGSDFGGVPGGDVGFGGGFGGNFGGDITGSTGIGFQDNLGFQTDLSDLFAGSEQDALEAINNMEMREDTNQYLSMISKVFSMVNPFMGKVIDFAGYLNTQAMINDIPPGSVDAYAGISDPNIEGFGTDPGEGGGIEGLLAYPGDEVDYDPDFDPSKDPGIDLAKITDPTVHVPGDPFKKEDGGVGGDFNLALMYSGSGENPIQGPLKKKGPGGITPAHSRIYESLLLESQRKGFMRELEGMMVPTDMLVDEFSV